MHFSTPQCAFWQAASHDQNSVNSSWLPDSNNLRDVLAYNIRLLRVGKGWSQEELSSQCGLDRTYVSAVECSRWNVSLSNIERMAQALDV